MHIYIHTHTYIYPRFVSDELIGPVLSCAQVICTHIHVYVYTHTHMYIYIYIYIHTHTISRINVLSCAQVICEHVAVRTPAGATHITCVLPPCQGELKVDVIVEVDGSQVCVYVYVCVCVYES